MSDLVWEDPPPKGSGPDSSERMDAMKSRPGEWLVWHTSPSRRSAASLGSDLRKRHPELEVLSRGVKVYARIPPQEPK